MSVDWGLRYRRGETPWDLGAPHPELTRRLASGQLTPTAANKALVPGCGLGHDSRALSQAGWQVTAVDVVADAGARLAADLETRRGRFLAADALGTDLGSGFDLIFEHTFFCALPPSQRPDWGRMIDRALALDGRLIAVVFPLERSTGEDGPPWTTTVSDLQRFLGDRFVQVADDPVAISPPGREGRERWAEFRRRDLSRADRH